MGGYLHVCMLGLGVYDMHLGRRINGWTAWWSTGCVCLKPATCWHIYTWAALLSLHITELALILVE